MANKINKDALGIAASLLCAVHCAVLPLLFTSFSVLGVNLVHNPAFEYGMIALAFLIGMHAMWHGVRRHHRRMSPWLLFTAGMALLCAKQVWHGYEMLILPFAVCLVVGAHATNWWFCRKADLQGSPGN
jgi:hypothetical protein